MTAKASRANSKASILCRRVVMETCNFSPPLPLLNVFFTASSWIPARRSKKAITVPPIQALCCSALWKVHLAAHLRILYGWRVCKIVDSCFKDKKRLVVNRCCAFRGNRWILQHTYPQNKGPVPQVEICGCLLLFIFGTPRQSKCRYLRGEDSSAGL